MVFGAHEWFSRLIIGKMFKENVALAITGKEILIECYFSIS
jgi:hypothetical protein